MQRLIITHSERLKAIPNSYFRNMVKNFSIFFSKSDIEVMVLNIDKKDLKKQIDIFCPNFIFFTRGYGMTRSISDFCKKKGVIQILQIDDLHYKNDKQRDSRHWSFESADFIMASYYDNFLKIKEYENYFEKVCNFPFFAPSSCFRINKKRRKDRMFFSGRCTKPYSLRREIFDLSKSNKNIVTLKHPGYYDLKHEVIGSKYYLRMNKYKYSLVTSADAPLDYPVLKFFELPAVGSFCFFEKIPSLAGLGFEDGKHYVGIDSKNIKEVVDNFKSYYDQNIVNNALDLVNKKHRAKNRFLQLIKLIKTEKVVHWNEV